MDGNRDRPRSIGFARNIDHCLAQGARRRLERIADDARDSCRARVLGVQVDQHDMRAFGLRELAGKFMFLKIGNHHEPFVVGMLAFQKIGSRREAVNQWPGIGLRRERRPFREECACVTQSLWLARIGLCAAKQGDFRMGQLRLQKFAHRLSALESNGSPCSRSCME